MKAIGTQSCPDPIGAGSADSGHRKAESGGAGVEDRVWVGMGARETCRMVAWSVPIVNNVLSLLSAYSNGEALIRMRVAEVERLEGVGGIETIW